MLVEIIWPHYHSYMLTYGLILGLSPANKKRRYNIAPSIIGWTQT